ncbi:Uncharacterised protein [Vibrio cholerae]|nr:Uncharacterised protein [Vibrio cholerae]
MPKNGRSCKGEAFLIMSASDSAKPYKWANRSQYKATRCTCAPVSRLRASTALAKLYTNSFDVSRKSTIKLMFSKVRPMLYM